MGINVTLHCVSVGQREKKKKPAKFCCATGRDPLLLHLVGHDNGRARGHAGLVQLELILKDGERLPRRQRPEVLAVKVKVKTRIGLAGEYEKGSTTPVPSKHPLPEVHNVAERLVPLNVAQKAVPHAHILMRAGHQSRHVGNAHPPVVIKIDDAQMRIDGRKRIRCHLERERGVPTSGAHTFSHRWKAHEQPQLGHLGMGVGDRCKQGRLARARHAYKPYVSEGLELQGDSSAGMWGDDGRLARTCKDRKRRASCSI